MPALIPQSQTPLADAGGVARREWYAFFSEIQRATTDPAIGQAIQSILDRLDALEDSGSLFDVIGLESVRVDGLPSSGRVEISLQGDTELPGATYYYGTNADGNKGWHTVASALAVEPQLVMTVGDDGVVTFDLAELADTGIGAALVKITRDAYGRVEGTEDAVLDDLSDVAAATPAPGDALVFDGTNWTPGQVATEQLFQRMTPEGDFRITADGNLRVTT